MSIRSFLTVRRKERKALLDLLIILGVLLLFRFGDFLWNYSTSEFGVEQIPISENNNITAVDASLLQDTNLYEATLPKLDSVRLRSRKYGKGDHNANAVGYSIEIKPIHPNEATVENWQALGFSPKQAQAIFKFLEKGRPLKYKEQLKRSFIIDDDRFQKLKKYIALPDSANWTMKKNEQNTKKALKQQEQKQRLTSQEWNIDINNVSAETLDSLPTIQSSLADRIVKYRNALGGFVHFNQLKEVYYLDSVHFEVLDRYSTLGDHSVVKMDLNAASKNMLAKHPYINWKVANSIVEIRRQHGKYKDLSELKNSELIGDDLYLKIIPYLEIR